MQEEKQYWLAINMNKAITPRRFQLLLDHFSSVREIWEASPAQLQEVEGFTEVVDKFCQEKDEIDLENELRRCRKEGLDILTLADQDYPDSLRAIDKPPPLLYVKGDYREEDQFAVAMVGTRKHSNYGEKIAEKLAAQLAKEGLTVVSGMARGIDSFSHRSALKAGGRTVAVMGTGFGQVYPKNNATLMKKISRSGAVLSEFPFKQGPTKWTFPQRNRIISGLTRGTIVVEAPQSSGALITAHDALNQGREVFAVPGDVRRKTAKGTHELIKNGAKLVEDASDVVEEFEDFQASLFSSARKHQEENPGSELTGRKKKVYSQLDYEPLHFNDLVDQTDFSPARLSHIMFQLEIEGLAEQLEGNRWVKVK